MNTILKNKKRTLRFSPIILLLILHSIIIHGSPADRTGGLNATYDVLEPHIKTALAENWLSPLDHQQPNMQYTCLRSTYALPEGASELSAYVTAGTIYRLYINGEFIMTGPAPCTKGYRFVDHVDLSEWKNSGSLSVALEWLYLPYKGGTTEFPEHSPGITFCLEADGKTIKSEEPWRYNWSLAHDQKDALLSGTRSLPMESVDLRKIHPDWLHPWYDDSGWSVIPGTLPVAIPVFLARPIPLPGLRLISVEQQSEKGTIFIDENVLNSPLTANEIREYGNFIPGITSAVDDGNSVTMLKGIDKGMPYVLFDMGEGTAGHVTINALIPEGKQLHVAFIQALDRFTGEPNRNHIYGSPTRFRMKLTGSGVPAGYESFHLFAGQYILLIGEGLSPGEEIRINQLAVRERSTLPHNTQSAYVTSSDRELNEVFIGSLKSMHLCTPDFPIDGMPDENKMYVEYCARPGFPAFYIFYRQHPEFITALLDMLLETRGSAKGWPSMPQQAVQRSNWPYFNTEVLFSFIHAVYDLHRYYGTEVPKRYLEAMKAMLDEIAQYENEYGLLESLPNTLYSHAMTLAPRGTRPYQSPPFNGVHIITNADYYSSLCLAHALTGETRYADRAEHLRDGLQTLCLPYLNSPRTSPRLNRFIPDVFIRTDKGLEPFSTPEVHLWGASGTWRSEATQYTLLDSRVLSKESENSLWDVLLGWKPYSIPTEDDVKVFNIARSGTYPTPFYRYRALMRMGRTDILLPELKEIFGQTQALTQWNADDARERTGGGIQNSMYASLIFECLTGITPGIDGGYSHSIIRPMPDEKMRWARGYLDTGKGIIGVKWNRTVDEFAITVTLPEGMKSDVILPPSAVALAMQGGHEIATGARYTLSNSAELRISSAKGVIVNKINMETRVMYKEGSR